MGRENNFRIIREFRAKTPVQVKEGTGISKQNISLWDNGKGKPGTEFIDQLVKFFDLPSEVFYRDSLTKEYLENHFSSEKLTDMDKASDNNGNQQDDPVWEKIEKSDKYTVVPTIILAKYEILSNREIESRELTLQEFRATMKIVVQAKDQVIAFLENEIADLQKKLEAATSQQTQ